MQVQTATPRKGTSKNLDVPAAHGRVAGIRPRLVPAIAVLTLAAGAYWLAGASSTTDATHRTIGPESRFEHVAVFAAGTPATAIEQWRQQVLARTHVQPCIGGRPCLSRALRLSSLGATQAEVLAFDLAADAPSAERAALLAAAVQAQPHATLHHDTTPRQAAGG